MKQETHIQQTDILTPHGEHLSLYELCHRSALESKMVILFVEHGVVVPEGSSPDDWRFSSDDLQRIQKALRLHTELEVNIEALDLVLNLLDELDCLREKVRRLEEQAEKAASGPLK